MGVLIKIVFPGNRFLRFPGKLQPLILKMVIFAPGLPDTLVAEIMKARERRQRQCWRRTDIYSKRKARRAVRREEAEKRLLEGCVLQLQQEGTHLSAVPGQEGGQSQEQLQGDHREGAALPYPGNRSNSAAGAGLVTTVLSAVSLSPQALTPPYLTKWVMMHAKKTVLHTCLVIYQVLLVISPPH